MAVTFFSLKTSVYISFVSFNYFDWKGVTDVNTVARALTEYTFKTLSGTASLTLSFTDVYGAEVPNSACTVTVTSTPQTISQLLSTFYGVATIVPVGAVGCEANVPSDIQVGYGGVVGGTPGASTPAAGTGAYKPVPGGSIVRFGRIQSEVEIDPIGVASLNAAYGLTFKDIGGAGCTIAFEFLDSTGATVPVVDGSAVAFSGGSLPLGASASGSLVYLLLHSTITDNTGATHTGCLLPLFAKVRIRCTAGTPGVPTLAIGFGGLNSGAAGTGGTGFNTGMGPGPVSPVQFYVGDYDSYGLGGH